MGFAGQDRGGEESDAVADRARVAAGAEAVDRRIKEVKILKAFAKQAGRAFVFRRAQLFPAFLR
jgi:hypothetical protein